jgi:hypothetical protein
MNIVPTYVALYTQPKSLFYYPSTIIQSDMEWEIEYRKEILKRALYCPLHIKKNIFCRDFIPTDRTLSP